MARVLLVDDDVDLQNANRTVLEAAGHEVALAYSASEARDALAAGVPDVVVLDVMMEEMDTGFETARTMRERYPDLPILMVTAINEATPFAFDYDKDETWAPVTRFVEKPVDPEALIAEIDALTNADE